MGAIVTLATETGLADRDVAAMKGVFLSINPRARLVDISHEIEPLDAAGARVRAARPRLIV